MKTLRKYIDNTHFSISGASNIYDPSPDFIPSPEAAQGIRTSISIGNQLHKYVAEGGAYDASLEPYINALSLPVISKLLDDINLYEQELDYEYKGVLMCGKYDGLDTKAKRVYDFKFSKKPKNPRWFLHYCLQLSGYSLGLGIQDGYIVNIFPNGYRLYYVNTLPYQVYFKQIIETLPRFYEMQTVGDLRRFNLFDLSRIRVKVKNVSEAYSV